MPTDEQLREQFEKWYIGPSNPDREWYLERSKSGEYRSECTESKWRAWSVAVQARDAEVQALREMLREGTRLLSHMEVSAGYCVCGESPERHPSDHQYVDTAQRVINRWIKGAAALAGGKGSSDD